MNTRSLKSFIMFTAVFLFTALGAVAEAASTAAEITGEIERLTLNNDNGVYSSGVMIVGGSQVILPKNLLIDLPANRLTLQQIFDQAPAACKANGESGLAKTDKCISGGTGGFATLSAVHSNAGNIIAGDVKIEKGTDVVSGVVSYINYANGYFRVNGIPGDSSTGAMVRINDPTGRHSVQQGPGCAGGPNCSPDPRFTLDPDNYVNTFSSGYPFCIPSTVSRTFTDVLGLGTTVAQSNASGAGDVLCPATNRTPGLIVEPDVNDSRLFAPLMVGDSINSTGNFEVINGVHFLSAHTSKILKALSTKNLPTQPDYMFLQEVFLEAPGFQNQRARMLVIGFTTLAPTDVDLWTIHRDPLNNSVHEFPLASVQGCDNASGLANGKPGFPNGSCSSQGLIGAGANIFRIRYDVDFLLAASGNPKYPGGAREDLNPCLQLQGSTRFTASNPGICASGITLANNFGIMSPIPREIQARTGHSIDHPGLITLDVRGNQATNGQYLFPFGINLGGVETADFLEIDINLLNTPRIFEGIPWNLDRRLSPGGCQNAGGCETDAIGSFALDPFPYTGLDPRTQADFLVAGLPGGTPKVPFSGINYTNSALPNASNRVFSYVSGTPFAGGKYNFDGSNTLLPCATGACPADPGLIPIVPTPAFNVFPPFADEDAAVVISGPGASVVIDVLANDIPVLGTIDPATLQIASAPADGTVQINGNHTITYTPANPFTVGTVTFTYTIANNYGSVSLPGTVTVTILRPPVTVADSYSVPALATVPLDLLGNDTVGTNSFNLVTVTIVSPPTCGTVTNLFNGSVDFTAPITTGTCSFSYRVSDSTVPPIVSNTSIATVTITPAIIAVANNDIASTTTGSSVNINVISNDTSATSTINPASLEVTAPTGGTAAANLDGTVTYKAPATPGTYTFTYKVKDNSGSPATSNPATVTVTVTPAAPAALSLFASAASPQYTGATINFAATGSGGNGSYEYRFSLFNGVSWSVVQPYSATPTWSWTPGAVGSYAIAAEIRNAGSTVDHDAITQQNYTITLPQSPVSSASLFQDKSSPQQAGTAITFATVATGGSGSYEYRYSLFSTIAGSWSVVRAYSSNPNWTWTPAVADIYAVAVDVRNAGSASDSETQARMVYLVAPQVPASGARLFVDKSSPQLAGTTVTFSSAGANGSSIYEYRYSLLTNDVWSVVRPYSQTPSWSWTPAVAGTYAVAVDIRVVGSTADSESQSIMIYYVQPSGSPTGVTLFHNLDSPQQAGTPITLSASGIGGSGNYEYQYSIFDTAWTVVRVFSSTPTFTWTPALPGSYLINVEVKNVGSPATGVSSGNVPYTIIP